MPLEPQVARARTRPKFAGIFGSSQVPSEFTRALRFKTLTTQLGSRPAPDTTLGSLIVNIISVCKESSGFSLVTKMLAWPCDSAVTNPSDVTVAWVGSSTHRTVAGLEL